MKKERVTRATILIIAVLAALTVWPPIKPTQAERRAIGVEGLPTNKLNTVSESPSNDSTGLFVGINDFSEDKSLASLEYAANDAIEQAHVFVRELKLIAPGNCLLCLSGSAGTDIARTQLKLLKQDGVEIASATKPSILRSLRIVTRVPSSRKDIVVVSFSTHGFESKQGIYLMPADSLRGFLDDTGIYSGTLTDSMSRSKAGKKMLILDACRERVDKGSRGGSGNAMSEEFRSAFMSSSGFATLMSCSIGQFSYEDSSSGHGVFSNYFIKALRGGASPDNRGFITVGSVSQYVSNSVRRWIIRNKPEVDDSNISTPWLGGPETARSIPLAIASNVSGSQLASARRQYQNLPISLSSTQGAAQQHIILPARPSRSDPAAGEVSTNSIGMKLVYIPAGEFMMGSRDSVADLAREYKYPEHYFADERPVHKVRISKGLWMGQTEVTQLQWQTLMGLTVRQQRDKDEKSNPLRGEGSDYPIYYVSWEDAAEFCRKLSVKEGKTYRLPTEAEWEYACRAGTTSRFCFGDNDSLLTDYAWYNDNSDDSTHPVGRKRPNSFGLYDMHGNVAELCSDFHHESYYSFSPIVDPQGPPSAEYHIHIVRGGGCSYRAGLCRSAQRGVIPPDMRYISNGFRVVFLPD